MVTTINQLQVKLIDAKAIHARINELKGHKDYKSPAEIQLQETQAEEKISKSKNIQAEFDTLKQNPSYMDPEEIRQCHKLVSDAAQLKLALKKSL